MSDSDLSAYADEVGVKLDCLADQKWRLNNLYWVLNEQGQRVLFNLRQVQDQLYETMWYFNIILKSRQHGITLFVCLYMLDTCLFNSNIRCCVIAHDIEDTIAFFRDKIKFPYDNLHPLLRAARPAKTDRKQEMLFANNSSVRVTDSGRSGTNNIVLASELGKTSATRPDRSKEVLTGSFETVHEGGMIFVESTAYGQQGDFYDMCKRAQDMARAGRELSKQDFKFHFFPWWRDPKNSNSDPERVMIPQRLVDYFLEHEKKLNIVFSDGQKAWYTKKEETLGGLMKREHPTTPEECFQEAIEGTYYATQFRFLRENKRIGPVPYIDGVLVDTWWDLGYGDTTNIWFSQNVGREVHFIDYYDNSGEGIAHYADQLTKRGYRYGRHVGPHDVMKGELGAGKSLKDSAAEVGIRFETSLPITTMDAVRVEPVRKILSICWFDEAKCERGLKALEAYRKEWDKIRGCWKDNAYHDWASHGADAFAVFAHNHEVRVAAPAQSDARPVRQSPHPSAWT